MLYAVLTNRRPVIDPDPDNPAALYRRYFNFPADSNGPSARARGVPVPRLNLSDGVGTGVQLDEGICKRDPFTCLRYTDNVVQHSAGAGWGGCGWVVYVGCSFSVPPYYPW